MNFRIGEGWDVHALVPGRRLVIGGVEIAHSMGLLGHSMRMCCCMPSPMPCWGRPRWGTSAAISDTDAAFRGADSGVLLAEAARRVRNAGYDIGNIDSTVVAQAPRSIFQPCACIAAALGVEAAQVNVKAKTAERLGPVGQGLAMEARAVALLFRA